MIVSLVRTVHILFQYFAAGLSPLNIRGAKGEWIALRGSYWDSLCNVYLVAWYWDNHYLYNVMPISNVIDAAVFTINFGTTNYGTVTHIMSEQLITAFQRCHRLKVLLRRLNAVLRPGCAGRAAALWCWFQTRMRREGVGVIRNIIISLRIVCQYLLNIRAWYKDSPEHQKGLWRQWTFVSG